MSIGFDRSLRWLAADSFRRSMWGLLVVMARLSVWGMWFFSARIRIYEVSATAHLEMTGAVAVQVPADGQIAAVHVTANGHVRPGDLLFDLDTSSQRLHIRAPVAGQLDIVDLHVGIFVHAGDPLGVIMPPGELRVTAEFSPQATLARIQPGQSARIRLDGFPTGEYDDIAATVSRVGGRSRDGLRHVELTLIQQAGFAVPLRHGLPVMVEVEVDQVPPATLMMRALR